MPFIDVYKRQVYDCCSCITAVIMSFSFFGLWHFEGVKLGTIICAMINGWLIGRIGAFLEKRFESVSYTHLKLCVSRC